MQNRRTFVKTIAGAAAGMYVAGRSLDAQAPPARKLAMVGGKRLRVVDGHCHWDMPIPASVVKGTAFEERIKGPCIDDRVGIMDKMGVDVNVIAVNDFWWYDTK